MSASRELEIVVTKIQERLAPDAEIKHDARLPGRLSGTQRQIDVLVRQRIGQYVMNIVLECKDYHRPVDVKGVEEFHGLVADVGAQKGALVCPKGFTKAAKERATGLQIDLYSPVDTDPHKWQVRVEAPMLCDFREAAMSFCVACSAPVPFMIPQNFFSSVSAFRTDGQELGTSVAGAIKQWNEGLFPDEPGQHEDIPIFDKDEVVVDNGYGLRVPVTLTVTLWVTRQLFFGHLPIERVSGFKDELSGKIITNAFTTGIFQPEEIVKHWKPIKDEAELPTAPIFALIGRCAWSDQVKVPMF